MSDNSSSYNDLGLLRRMLLEARPFWGRIGVLFFVNLLSMPLALLTPLPIKIVVDHVLGTQPLPKFLQILLPEGGQSDGSLLLATVSLVILIALLSGLQNFGSSLLRTTIAEKMVRDFRAKIFRHVQFLSIAYHDTKGITDSSYRIQYDASAVQRLSMETVIPFLTAAFTVVAMVYIIAKIDFQLAIVALMVAPLMFLIVRMFKDPLREQWRKVKILEHSAWKAMNEALDALRVVKAFGQEDREQVRFVKKTDKGVRARIKVEVAQGTYGLLVGVLTAAGTAAVLYIGVGHVREGTLTLGALLVVMSYLTQLMGPLNTIARQFTNLQGALASAERVFAVLDESPEVLDRADAKTLDRSAGRVEFENLTFEYEEGRPVLNGISFQAPAGSRVGIAGKTGAGKTTLLNLLTRFYDPQEGRILLDDVDIREFRLRDYRKQFAIVLQEPVLFSTTIAENISYGKPEATDEEIYSAAQMANAHEFISELPEGYDTLVGHRGMRLSGGERQRIGLARAFLRDAPILILDEPTSSVDMKTETGIIEAMDALMKGRTTFMIAHRLSTLENCDMLLVIERGKLVRKTEEVGRVVQDAIELGFLEADDSGEPKARK